MQSMHTLQIDNQQSNNKEFVTNAKFKIINIRIVQGTHLT